MWLFFLLIWIGQGEWCRHFFCQCANPRKRHSVSKSSFTAGSSQQHSSVSSTWLSIATLHEMKRHGRFCWRPSYSSSSKQWACQLQARTRNKTTNGLFEPFFKASCAVTGFDIAIRAFQTTELHFGFSLSLSHHCCLSKVSLLTDVSHYKVLRLTKHPAATNNNYSLLLLLLLLLLWIKLC